MEEFSSVKPWLIGQPKLRGKLLFRFIQVLLDVTLKNRQLIFSKFTTGIFVAV
jgi:hypothetical protein